VQVTDSQPTVPKGHADRGLRDRKTIRHNAWTKDLIADSATTLAMVGDLAAIVAGLIGGFWIRFRTPLAGHFGTRIGLENPSEHVRFAEYWGLIAAGAGMLFLTFLYLKVYQRETLLRFRKVWPVVTRGAVFWFCAYLGISLTMKFNPPISRVYAAFSFFMVTAAVLSWRAVFHRVIHWEAVAKKLRLNVLFIGWNREALRVAESIFADKSQPYAIAGCIPAPSGGFQSPPPAHIWKLGEFENLGEVFRDRAINIAIMTDLDNSMQDVVGVANLCERELVQFKVIPSYFQIMVAGLQLERISGVPIMGVTDLPLNLLLNRVVKRAVDIVGAIVGLMISTPLIALFGAMIYLESPGPIFYRQVRTGRKGRNFEIIKLRSMRLDAEQNGAQWAKKGDERCLRVGAFLREWNVDEVPQFWNVLKGEMSLVGPRPERPELIAKFQDEIPHYNARLASKPGITGWAQVNGLRGDTDLAERVRYDLYYLEHWSLMLDFQIMLQTFFRRENAY
jgi:exopolysaccharide biosynthesis polyprenyl glycosylphosphotransferase